MLCIIDDMIDIVLSIDHLCSDAVCLSLVPAYTVQAFMPRLLHRCGVECFVTGNYSRAETLQLGQYVEKTLKVCALLSCCAVPCCTVLRRAVLCCAVLCCAVLCRAVLCCEVLCCAVLCCAVLCCAVLCCAAPTVLSMLYCLT